jgi:hypothetical protein
MASMRLGVVLAALLSAVFASTALALDTGRSRPPGNLTEDGKALWMGEWVACQHKRLGALASEIGVKVPPGRSVQRTARLIAKTAEAPLWSLDSEFATGVDGCRNGILWRFYHSPTPKR